MHAPISPAILADLRRPRPYPAVSVLLPTHRREPDNAQDAVRLRNLLEEAKDAVHNDPEVSRADRIDVIGQLDQALGEVDLVHAEDGLAIFAAPGEHQVWTLARTVPARVLLAQTFLTRNLVAAHVANQPFWVLALSADVATMWSGTKGRAPEQFTGTFPVRRVPEDFDPEREERIGDTPSTFNDERTRQFLREVTESAGVVVAADPRPMYVVGESEALAALDDAGKLVKEAAGLITQGGLAEGPAEALRQALATAAGTRAQEEVAGVLSELDDARSRKAFMRRRGRGVAVGRGGAGGAGRDRGRLPHDGAGRRRPPRPGGLGRPGRAGRHRRRDRRAGARHGGEGAVRPRRRTGRCRARRGGAALLSRPSGAGHGPAQTCQSCFLR